MDKRPRICLKGHMQTTGKVWLIGAGPGDAQLLTLKALNTLKSVKAVVYDRLVSEEVLAFIPPGVERHFAGKSCKQKAMTQEEINALLIRLATEGKTVARLKGGDPFFFGRGGEEAQACEAAHIPCESIPGITSAQGCAAALGIPLTHRTLATGVRYITGHRTSENEEQPLNLPWQSLADAETTLVVYMGLANLSVISQQLMAHGLSGQTPAVAISHGTTPAQRTCFSTLEQLPAQVLAVSLESPVLVIIGRVVSLARPPGQALEKSSDSSAIFTKMSY